ncbi:hypothetical protein [Nonomuraea typhae]|uniref:Uncharacterized protein n=1 Tax=Nonomuraea typhae TaxID=2603600 RepID=A0ABW7YLP7_9ACTN
MTPDLVWEDPPEPKGGGYRGPGRYVELAAQLKTRPGKWARAGVFNRTSHTGAMTSAVREGRSGFEPKGAFEATTRTIKPGMEGHMVLHVYVRYVGGEER